MGLCICPSFLISEVEGRGRGKEGEREISHANHTFFGLASVNIRTESGRGDGLSQNGKSQNIFCQNGRCQNGKCQNGKSQNGICPNSLSCKTGKCQNGLSQNRIGPSSLSLKNR